MMDLLLQFLGEGSGVRKEMVKEMVKRYEYAGIDLFRVIASFMVVAIHTGPLSFYSGTADFYLTYCISRIGVPFFYMVTGYFVLSGYREKSYTARVRKTVKRLLFIYLGMTALYFPVNWYAGNLPKGIGPILRWLLFDGTFYHLWYLPGAALGCLFVWMLLKRNGGVRKAAMISAVLYIIGVFGDSWYGAAERISFIKTFYDGIFTLFSYTRNGIFFAPLFLVMGVCLAQYKINHTRVYIWTGFGISLLLLLAEGGITRFLGWQKHNSMYLCLIPVMLFLFEGLLRVGGHALPSVRTVSMWIYLLHPLWIVGIRGGAKAMAMAMGSDSVPVQNSGIFYLEVCTVSCVAGCILSRFWTLRNGRKKKVTDCKAQKRRAWIELNWKHLEHNVAFFRGILPESCTLMPAVKANAYGHGAVPVAKALEDMGIRDFCVASAAEGIQLREAGIRGQILILGYTEPDQLEKLVTYRLTQTVVDADYAEKLKSFGRKLYVHVGIDTGMHRLGFHWEDISAAAAVWDCKTLRVTGVFSHLCAADRLEAVDVEFTETQIKRFGQVLCSLRDLGIGGFWAHLLGSYGILNYSRHCYDFARVGISLYGVKSCREDKTRIRADLKPVLELKARVESIKELKKGESAGYGLDFTAERDSCIAILAVGYADGVPRNISGLGYVLCSGQKAPIIGRICMDQMLVDITGIGMTAPGDEAVLIGRSGEEEILAEDMAAWSGTITNEILSRMGQRLERIPIK